SRPPDSSLRRAGAPIPALACRLLPSRQGVFYLPQTDGRNRHAPAADEPREDAFREVPPVPAPRARGPQLAEQADREGSPLVLRRPPGRQPGADRADG